MGLKTIILRDMRFDVTGSDGSFVAIGAARELARTEEVDISFFCADWSELGGAIRKQFDAVFCDALSWTVTRKELERSLAGIREVLKPGGALIWSGAPLHAPEQSAAEVIEEIWRTRQKFKLAWCHESGEQRCTALRFEEKFADYIDAHHVYILEEAGWQRMEVATVREPAYWNASLMNEILSNAGFRKSETKSFPIPGQKGNVAYNLSWK